MTKKVIGLTGGIACGKSTAAQFLAELGWCVIDTDEIARDVVRPREEGWKQIQEKFGVEFFNPDQTLNRKKLAETVFNDSQKLAKLNALLHPLIRERWKIQATDLMAQEHKVAVVIPLLYETNAEKDLGAVVVVGCSETVAFQRAQDRGWDESHFKARVQGQWPLAKKMALADFVVWNDGSLELLKRQIQQLHQQLL